MSDLESDLDSDSEREATIEDIQDYIEFHYSKSCVSVGLCDVPDVPRCAKTSRTCPKHKKLYFGHLDKRLKTT